MPKEFFTFDDYVAENRYDAIEKNMDFSVVAPQFFNNGFNLGNGWFKHWCTKNNFQVETFADDNNFLAVYDSMGKWIAAYHQHKGKIFTNRTLQQLHESAGFDEEFMNEASVVKIQKDLAKEYKKDKGNKKIVDQLKELTAKKKQLEAALDAAVSVLDDEFDESVHEASKVVKALRKLGWSGDSWTPQEYKDQIRNLSDETLLLWSKDKKGIPYTTLAFQQKLVKSEIERRGLKESITEKKDHILVLTTKDGKKHKSQPMEKAIADKAMKKMLKHSKKDMKGVEVLALESVTESFEDSSLVDDLIQESYFKPIMILEDAAQTLESMYEGEVNPDVLDEVIESLESLLNKD